MLPLKENQGFQDTYSITKISKICLLNGKNTKKLGVEEKKLTTKEVVLVTNLERTLIDIAVRPVYSGDTLEILNAYRKAKNKISIDTLAGMLKKN